MNDLNETVDSSKDDPKSPVVDTSLTNHPRQIGRYRVEKILGEGGFGRVYLAHDDQLRRTVAIKVPRPERLSRSEEAEAYLTEARTVASLDHPNIVPIFDVGTTLDGLCYVVSKVIDGSDLAKKVREERPSHTESAGLIATVAEALHYAHRKGVVHRDIKPANILIDADDKPYVADFGLALREEDFGKEATFAGTPAYMSPEQARGEGHRVDGRSDLFSLGVVFYELLVGRRPFKADSLEELLEQITKVEARPPRQVDDQVPKELERICLKALSKRASERYTTAKDMADDLRHFLGSAPAEEKSSVTLTPVAHAAASTPVASSVPTPTSDQRPMKIVPKGLRSFDANDADFFLELLPGPRDRDGLPDSIRFWKTRMEATDPDDTFSVGLIYGPSGCGKSSLVKAGLLPRLAKHVIAVYVEATAEETEARLLKGLRKHCPDVPENLGAIETLASLRRGHFLPAGKKVVIVLDQFEQWLHAKKEEQNTELVQALRQCDGGRVQSIVMVRDDFWMAATRFMRELEVRLLEGQNSAAVDLFPIRHAEKVLAAFGRAFGALPEADRYKPIDPSLQALVSLLEHLSKQYSELREGVQKAIQVADVDPEMALTRTRKVLEYVIRDVYERRINEPPGTRPLENLLQRIVKGGHFPERLDAYANTIRKLGNVGTHTFGEKVTVADVHQSLTQLMPILKWYLEIEQPKALLGNQARAQPAPVAGGSSAVSKEQKEFIEQAVSGLAQEGKVISVRLALFAEMMKGKAWTPATLKEVGGTEGVGVTFLEETFAASTAPPQYRLHQRAVLSVLKALLPETWTEIKGHMRTVEELLAASGYADQPIDFRELLRILDGELRLITPTDPEGVDSGARGEQLSAGERYYQLTHDYLVPSIREWLIRKQKESRQGRAELRLAIWSSVWNAKPENRNLPSWWEWPGICLLTRNGDWTPPQQKMMRQATRYHVVRGLVAFIILSLLGWGAYEGHGSLKAHALRDRLLDANTNEVPTIVKEMVPYRRWLDPLLRDPATQAETSQDARKHLHVSLALLPATAEVDYLYGRLLEAAPHEVPVVRDALALHKDELLEKLWAIVMEPTKGQERQRVRAACALATYDPASQRWDKSRGPILDQLVGENPVFLGLWMEGFRPVKGKMLAPLASIYRDGTRRESERTLVTNMLADYAADQPQVLADLLMDADEKQFAIIYPKFKEQVERGLLVLTGEIDKKLPPNAKDEAKEKLAMRQANAAVALLRLKQPEKVWPLLKHSSEPRMRSYLIHRLGPLGAEPGAIVKRLAEEPDVTVRRALILSLGEFGEQELSPDARKALLPKLQVMYRTASDPGLHAAAEWLLRSWKQEDWLKQVNEEWAKEQHEKHLEAIKQELTKEKDQPKPRWYVNGQGQTMVVLPGPVEFMMGSPPTEKGRDDTETLHRKRIGRTFAIAAKLVTVREYRLFDKEYKFAERFAPTPACPVLSTSWYQAATYCNWLSKQEGIPPKQWSYETNPQGQVTKLKGNYLILTGYRLPTEAEMEYATRGGAVTTRCYGGSDDLLPKYGWYLPNCGDRTWPVGSLKPNDSGLFDMHGSVYCWCQEKFKHYSQSKGIKAEEDTEDDLSVNTQDERVLRGGSFNSPASYLRSAYRLTLVPANSLYIIGFRVGRTVTAQ